MCRELLAVGANPDTALAIYGSGGLALRIRSIREGARFTSKTPNRALRRGNPGTPLGRPSTLVTKQEAAGATQ